MNRAQFDREYKKSLANPDAYWSKEANSRMLWRTKWKKAVTEGKGGTEWFKGATLNITESCLDSHVKGGKGSRTAYIEVNELDEERRISYQELLAEVNKCANAFKKLGIRKSDVVAIYMPASIEQIIAMLATARIGAMHTVVFAGLSAEALHERMVDARAKLLVTAEGYERRGKRVDMLALIREARKRVPTLKTTLVVNRFGGQVALLKGELDWHDAMRKQSAKCIPVYVKSTDPLFVLYTSGSTGKPKGVVHASGGYGLFAAFTTAQSFALKKSDIYWCTADAGWITGHSYLVYGPLMNGVTSLLVAGAPNYPAADRWWQLLEKYKVSAFYTSPTAIRLLRLGGTKSLAKLPLKKLRVIGSVGEPLNPEVARWYQKYVGKGRAHLVDTWWQTETGGHMITTLRGMPIKPGFAGLPMFGVEAEVIDESGNRIKDDTRGILVIKNKWPGALVSCLNDEKRYKQYWDKHGYFTTGDIAIRDKNGLLQILGRYDDVISVSGHRIGSAELEHAALSMPAVGEAAAIGISHDIKGEAIKLFCVLKPEFKESDAIKNEISAAITKAIGGFARPEEIVFVSKLPKTRSGKIMRRLLRKQEKQEPLGDLSTLDD